MLKLAQNSTAFQDGKAGRKQSESLLEKFVYLCCNSLVGSGGRAHNRYRVQYLFIAWAVVFTIIKAINSFILLACVTYVRNGSASKLVLVKDPEPVVWTSRHLYTDQLVTARTDA